jgi:hypothetical protein
MNKKALLLVVAVACGSTKETPTSPAPAATLDDSLPASCSPLRTKGACMLPWPNAIYLKEDPSTKTGFRLDIPMETLPVVGHSGKGLDPARYNFADGFSPATPMLVYFPEHIDPASLVRPDQAQASLENGSATVIVDMETKQRVAHFSEVDLTAAQDEDRRAVMIRPMQRLLPKHRYAVAVTRSVKTIKGELPTAPPLFAAIADGQPPEGALAKKQAARMPDILSSLKSVGVAREDLVVAWDFVTGSDEQITSHVIAMRDKAFEQIGPDGLGYTITSSQDDPSNDAARRIKGTFTVPRFLTHGDSTKADAYFVLDAQGMPTLQGTYEVPFTAIIPKAAKNKALPLMLLGHGLLGTGEGMVNGMQGFAQRSGYVIFGTDWTGLSRAEDPVGGTNGAAGEALTDFNRLPYVTDRLQQGLINAMVLVRTMRGKIAKDAQMQIDGHAAADTSKVQYLGISLGGIMGGSFMGYGPDVTEGVLGVPGGIWSTMFQRSSNWPRFKLLIGGAYSDYVDQQLLLAIAQMQFDYSDPISVAPHWLQDPLPGVPVKRIVMLEATNDSQVPNIATEAVARTAGLPLVGDSPKELFAIAKAGAAAPSGISLWETKLQPYPPLTNATPEKDNGAHNAVFQIGKLWQQVDHFLKAGEMKAVCEGACDPE